MAIDSARTITIVGGGFCGVVAAIHVLRSRQSLPTRLVLVERSPDIARGATYARRPHPFILNVPAARMSATPSDPNEFLAFAQTRLPDATAEDFLSRELYGDYLEATLQQASLLAGLNGIRFERLHDEVIDLDACDKPTRYRLTLASGVVLNSDEVVLALGNPPAAPLPIADRSANALSVNPWNPEQWSASQAPIFVLGSGLTMVDTVSALNARSSDREIHVLSRHGLLPLSQTDVGQSSPLDPALDEALRHAPSLRAIVRTVTAVARRVDAEGGDWRDVVMHVRHAVPTLWRRLTLIERQRFLRHVRPYWDVHRHRVPTPARATLERLQATRRLTIHAGYLRHVEATLGGIRVQWRPRGATTLRELLVERVFNCTGPDYDVTRCQDPLWVALRERGYAKADALRLGIETDDRLALINTAGVAMSGLYYVGPMLRATYWEATAVAELRGHAARLAERLSAGIAH